MQKPVTATNPLIMSVIHKPFARGVGEIGLPEFLKEALTKQLVPHLAAIGSPFAEREQEVAKLAHSILRGEVIGAETEADGSPLFFVRGGVGQTGMSVRLTCRNRDWQVESIGSLYTRSVRQSPLLMRSIWSAAVVVAAVIGFTVHAPLQHLMPAADAGSSGATKQTLGPAGGESAGMSNRAAGGGATSSGTGTSSNAASFSSTGGLPTAKGSAGGKAAGSAVANKTPTHAVAKTPAPPASKTVSYNLTGGTSLYALAQFLQSQHLVANAMNFDMAIKQAGIDRNIHPGTYVFARGSNTQQLLAVLRKGPAK